MGLLFSSILAEEMSILKDASVKQDEVNSLWTWEENALISGGFKAQMQTNPANRPAGQNEFYIILNASNTILTTFVLNVCGSSDKNKRLGTSAIWIGDDFTPYSTSLTKCSVDFFDTGFQSMTIPCTGKHVVIRRAELPRNGDRQYNLHQLRVYQVPNLLNMFKKTIKIISAPDPKEDKYKANEIIDNLTRRSSGNNLKALETWAGKRSEFESCFKTTDVQLGPIGHKMVITIDLGKILFVHCLLVVQDLFDGLFPNAHINTNEFLQNLEFYIGNDTDYTKNAKCPGGPFMVVGDYEKSYTFGAYNSQEASYLWNYGVEAWCNLEGRYVTIVADLTELIAPYEMTICSLGIMGAEYVRLTPMPSSVDVS